MPLLRSQIPLRQISSSVGASLSSTRDSAKMKSLASFVVFLLATGVSAHFQFFDQFFGGQQQQQQQQEPQNVPSDSNWYQQSWEGGKLS